MGIVDKVAMFTKQNNSTLASRVFRTLKDKIVTGELAQGSKITEDNLAKTFSINREPLREALRQLESVRLINRIPHAGVRVTTLTLDLIIKTSTLCVRF